MPLITVDCFPGKAPAQKRAFVAAVTEAAVTHLGVRPEGVLVLLREAPPENWGWGGRLASEIEPGSAGKTANG